MSHNGPLDKYVPSPLCAGIVLKEDKFKMTAEVVARKSFEFALSHQQMTRLLTEMWGDRISEQKQKH